MMRNSIWILVPAYDEEKYIGNVLQKLLQVTKNIVVIDDGSSDSTSLIVNKLGVICLHHPINLGKGAAMKTGCDYVFTKRDAEAVIFMDSDDQHNIDELPLFMHALDEGFDVVLGYRKERENMPRLRQIGNQFSSFVVWLLFGIMVKDIPSGYRAFTKFAYEKLRWESSGYEVETEIIVRIAATKLRYIEVPISTVYHDVNKGFSLIDGLVILIKLLHWRIASFTNYASF